MFTPAQRETVITLIERGQSVKNACESVGVATRTFRQWIREGNEAGDGSERAVFANRYEIAKIRQADQGLSKDDLIRLLEVRAREGHVEALKLLLNRPWDCSKELSHGKPEKPKSMADELAQFRARKAASDVE